MPQNFKIFQRSAIGQLCNKITVCLQSYILLLSKDHLLSGHSQNLIELGEKFFFSWSNSSHFPDSQWGSHLDGLCGEEGEKQGKCPSQGAGALVWCFRIIPSTSPFTLKNWAPWWCCSSSGWGRDLSTRSTNHIENRFEVLYLLCWLWTMLFPQKNSDGNALWEFPELLCLFSPHSWEGWPGITCSVVSVLGFLTTHTLHLEKMLSADAESWFEELYVPPDKVTGPISNLASSLPWMCSDSSRHTFPALATDKYPFLCP